MEKIKVTHELPDEFNIGVILNRTGEITIQIKKELSEPIKSGHQKLGNRHTTWFCIDYEIVALIESAVKHKNKWCWR